MHFAKHLIRHAVSANIKEEKAKSKPVIIAPIILVAANVIANRTTDVNIAPNIPVNNTDKMGQIQFLTVTQREDADTAKSIARYTTAIPKATHKNAGVTVIVAVIVRNAVTTPIRILAIIATTEQLDLQQQNDIHYSPPAIIYVLNLRRVTNKRQNATACLLTNG